jgi:hypothetical protein
MSATVRTVFGISSLAAAGSTATSTLGSIPSRQALRRNRPVLGIGRGGGRALVSQDRSRNYLFAVINSGRMIRRTIITRRLPAQLSFNRWCLDVARGLAHGRR